MTVTTPDPESNVYADRLSQIEQHGRWLRLSFTNRGEVVARLVLHGVSRMVIAQQLVDHLIAERNQPAPPSALPDWAYQAEKRGTTTFDLDPSMRPSRVKRAD